MEFNKFDQAVFAYYMEHGQPATVRELSQYSGISSTALRRFINANKCRSACTSKTIPIIERNYGTVASHRRVDAYQPSLRMMREVISRLVQVSGLAEEDNGV